MATQEQEKEIIDLYVNQGYSYRRIASKYGISYEWVRLILKKKNVEITKNRVHQKQLRFINLPTSDILKHYNSGMSVSKLSKMYSVSFSKISSLLRDEGICLSDKKIINKYSQEICQKYLEGYSTLKIAKMYSCSTSHVLNILNKNKIKVRSITEAWELKK